MRILSTAVVVATIFAAGVAHAEFQKINDKDAFVDLVEGRELTRALVNLEVAETGEISGTGALWAVTGTWTWEEGYFCRDLFWGGDALGYNCQEVQSAGDRIRFTSDRGNGDSAEFSLQ